MWNLVAYILGKSYIKRGIGVQTTCRMLFFFSSRRRHTRSVSAFLLNRSSDLHSFPTRRTLFHVLVGCGLLMLKVSRLRSEERRVGKECRSRRSTNDKKKRISQVPEGLPTPLG